MNSKYLNNSPESTNKVFFVIEMMIKFQTVMLASAMVTIVQNS